MLPLPSAAQSELCVAAPVPLSPAALRVRAFLRSAAPWSSTDFSFPPSHPPKPRLFPSAPEVRPRAKPHLTTQLLEDAFAAIRKPEVDQVYVNYTLFSS